MGELVTTVFRDHLYLAYEIPKWDGHVSRASVYVPLPTETARHKVELLQTCFPLQRGHSWWDDELFLGAARRGIECRERYAEAFTCSKLIVQPAAPVPAGR